MFDQFFEWVMAIPNSVPILLGAEPHNAMLVRALAALLLIAFVAYLIAMRPFRGIIARLTGKAGGGKGKVED